MQECHQIHKKATILLFVFCSGALGFGLGGVCLSTFKTLPILKGHYERQGGSRTTCLACFRDHILLQSLKYVDTLTLFSKNLNQRSLTPRWPLTPCLLRSHVWLYPRIIVSKSHDNTSMYVDTVINFAKYHIHAHTMYILHTTYRMSDHLLLNSVQARQKWYPFLGIFLKINAHLFIILEKPNHI